MYSNVIIVNNTVTYLKFANNVRLKCSYHTEIKNEEKENVTIFCGEYINQIDCGDYFTMYVYTKTSSCTP